MCLIVVERSCLFFLSVKCSFCRETPVSSLFLPLVERKRTLKQDLFGELEY